MMKKLCGIAVACFVLQAGVNFLTAQTPDCKQSKSKTCSSQECESKETDTKSHCDLCKLKVQFEIPGIDFPADDKGQLKFKVKCTCEETKIPILGDVPVVGHLFKHVAHTDCQDGECPAKANSIPTKTDTCDQKCPGSTCSSGQCPASTCPASQCETCKARPITGMISTGIAVLGTPACCDQSCHTQESESQSCCTKGCCAQSSDEKCCTEGCCSEKSGEPCCEDLCPATKPGCCAQHIDTMSAWHPAGSLAMSNPYAQVAHHFVPGENRFTFQGHGGQVQDDMTELRVENARLHAQLESMREQMELVRQLAEARTYASMLEKRLVATSQPHVYRSWNGQAPPVVAMNPRVGVPLSQPRSIQPRVGVRLPQPPPSQPLATGSQPIAPTKPSSVGHLSRTLPVPASKPLVASPAQRVTVKGVMSDDKRSLRLQPQMTPLPPISSKVAPVSKTLPRVTSTHPKVTSTIRVRKTAEELEKQLAKLKAELEILKADKR